MLMCLVLVECVLFRILWRCVLSMGGLVGLFVWLVFVVYLFVFSWILVGAV
jgi:hypothetical protein